MSADERDLQPRENTTVAEQPATVEACRADFKAGAADRATSVKKDAHAGHRRR